MKFYKIYQVLIIATLGFIGCKDDIVQKETKNEGIAVETQKVVVISTSKQLKVSANIEGNKTVRLGFLVAGKINYIALNEGEIINKGVLLASLDPESYQIALEMADANLDQMQDDYNRVKVLHERKSVTESDFVKVTNGLRSAKAQRRLQAKNLEDTKLYAPIKGVLLKKGVEEGEIIDKGLQVFAISDIFSVKVNAAVPEMELQYMKPGREAGVHISSLDTNFIGKIVEIGTLADPATRTFNVKIELNNPRLQIRPGMTAEVNIQTGDTKNIISLPSIAILHDENNGSYVYVADAAKKQAFKRNVSLGNIMGDNIEIISGLNPDELVIVSGQHKLTNGTSINIK